MMTDEKAKELAKRLLKNVKVVDQVGPMSPFLKRMAMKLPTGKQTALLAALGLAGGAATYSLFDEEDD